MKKNWYLDIRSITCFVVIILSFTFFIGYKIWFSDLFCSPVEQNVIVLQVSTIDNPENIGEDVVILSRDQWQQFTSDLEDLKEYNNYTSNNYLTISHLNGFYAAIFAAIMLFIALIALIGWKRLSQTFEQIDHLEEFGEKIKWLSQKREDAEWIKNKFNSEDINSSYKLNLFNDEQERFERMKEHLMDEHEHEGWREIIIAHEYVSQKYIKDADLDEAEKIYNSIELRNIFKDKSELEPLLYHLKGQLYKRKFDLLNNRNADSLEAEHKLLTKSKEYYEKSLVLESDNAQTFGNIAVVFIELYKNESAQKMPAKSYLSEAQRYLEKQKKISEKNRRYTVSYHYWWDCARVEFYLKEHENRIPNQTKDQVEWDSAFINKIEGLLYSAVNSINSQETEENEKNREFFINKIIEEFHQKDELMRFDIMAFPGNKELIERIRIKLKMAE